MKKHYGFLAALLAVGALSSCDLFGKKEENKPVKPGDYDIMVDVTGGTAEEQEALLKAVNTSIVTKNAQDRIDPDSQIELKEDDGDYLRLVTSYTKKGVTTTFEWGVETNNEYFKELKDADASGKYLYINYKGYEHKNETGTLSFWLSKVQCGDAVAANPDVRYTVNIKNEQYHHVDVSIADINRVTEGPTTVDAGGTEYVYPSTFDMVDYSYTSGQKYSPYFIKDPLNAGMEKDYYYVNVKGKIIYYAPDGNWALLADGDQILELYAGSALDLTPDKNPYMANDYVVVSGNLSQYNGNIQLGFITKILPLQNHSEIAEPTLTYAELDTAKLKLEGYNCQKQAIDGFSNSLAAVTGTVVAGSLKDRDGNATTVAALQNNRFTFEILTASGDKVTVAYDYHTDKDKSVGLFDALKVALGKTTTITIKGTMRYNGSDSSPFAITSSSNGVWNIVPFVPANVIL